MHSWTEVSCRWISANINAVRTWVIPLTVAGILGACGDLAQAQFRDITPKSHTESNVDETPAAGLLDPPSHNTTSQSEAPPSALNADRPNTDDMLPEMPTKTTEQGAKPLPTLSDESHDSRPQAGNAQQENSRAQAKELEAKREKQIKKQIEATLIDDTEVRPLPFRGITVGTSTEEDVMEAWGEPYKIDGQRQTRTLKYRLDPFRQVDVELRKGKVRTILIHLDGLLSAKRIEKELRMTKIRPALVNDEFGRPIGLTYPERGVLLSYDTSDPDALVSKIQLEPISVESFLLRATSGRGLRYEANLKDLQTAVELDGDNARAHWLRALQFEQAGRFHDALGSSAKATYYDQENLEYRLTRIGLIAVNGTRDIALRETKMLLEQSDITPEIRAATLSLLGELLTSSDQPKANKMGMDQQLKAIEIAAKLVNDPVQQVRRSAKLTLIKAHLAVARNISLGEFQKQQDVTPKWLSRARALVDDFVENEQGDPSLYLDLYREILATAADIRNDEDPGFVIQQLQTEAHALMDKTKDPLYKNTLEWKLGAGLAEAVRLQRQRGNTEGAISLADSALELLKTSARRRQSTPEQSYLIGRLYFHYGSLHAVQRKDHEEAVKWYHRAEPLLAGERPVAALADPATHGEIFVSMGVSYWETSDRQKAIELTEFGTDFLQRAVVDGRLTPDVLSIPYNNLASMHKQMGNQQEARAFAELAAEVDGPQEVK